MAFLQLEVSSSGATCYKFKTNYSSRNSIKFEKDAKMGYQSFALSKISTAGDSLVMCQSIFCIPIGCKSRHICFRCFSISSKVKTRSDCEQLSFCSIECMNEESTFLDINAALLDDVFKRYENQQQLLEYSLLTVRIVHSCITSSFMHSHTSKHCQIDLWELVQLEHHPETNLEEIGPCVDFINAHLIETIGSSSDVTSINTLLNALFKKTALSSHTTATSSSSYTSATSCSSHTSATSSFSTLLKLLITRIFRAIYFNAHTIVIPSMEQTYILCIIPVLSRLNHSCTPNCYLTVNIPSGLPTSHSNIKTQSTQRKQGVQVVLHTLAPIKAGEELTISYVRQLCIPVENRRILLLNSFRFNCSCNRCILESNTKNKCTVVTTQEKIILSGHQFMVANVHQSLSNSTNRIHTCIDTDMHRQLDAIVDFVSICRQNHTLPTTNSVPIKSFEQLAVIYACHDLAMSFITSPKTDSNPKGNVILKGIDHLRVVLRCCWVVSTCWDLFGCSIHPTRLDYILYGLTVKVASRSAAIVDLSVILGGTPQNQSSVVHELNRHVSELVTDGLKIVRVLSRSLPGKYVRETTLLEYFNDQKNISSGANR